MCFRLPYLITSRAITNGRPYVSYCNFHKQKLSVPQALTQIRKESALSLEDKAKLWSPLMNIDCNDGGKTMEAVQLL